MSKTIYERINEKYIYLKSCINNTSSFRNTLLISLELLLKIINDKNDDEFNEFYIKYMSNFQLKRYYFARLFNPFKECNFNKFDNLNDFIDKSYLSPCSVNEEFYYIELNKFLNDILIINLKLENEKKEKEEEVKKTSIKINVKKSETIKDNDKKKKKKTISATIKRLVWNTNIGEDVGKSKCMCCYSTDITQMSFNCGHIVAEANGGETIVSNLKPICQNCNSSMGTKNMEEFMKSLK